MDDMIAGEHRRISSSRSTHQRTDTRKYTQHIITRRRIVGILEHTVAGGPPLPNAGI